MWKGWDKVWVRLDPPLPVYSQRIQIQNFLIAHSAYIFSNIDTATSTLTSIFTVSTVPLLPLKPDSPLPAKPDPPLPADLLQCQCVREVSVNMSEQWNQAWACQSCGRMTRYTATSLLPARPYPNLIRSNSVSNGSSFKPSRLNRSAWQQPYPINNRRFSKWTITSRPKILIWAFTVCYAKYAAQHGASFGSLRFSISLNHSKL